MRKLTEDLGLGLTGGGVSFDYYVDSVNGSDANNGLSAATAKQTLAAGKALLSSGKTLGLARGSHWRESLDLSSMSNVGVRGYGSTADPLPKIDCSDVAANASFSLAAAQTKTYQITWTHSIAADISTRKLRAWENGTRLKWVSSIANCEAEAGTFFVDNTAIANPATIYVHPNGDTNPTSDGKTYEITAREQALIMGSGYDVRNVHTTRNALHDGSFYGGQGTTGYGYGILSTDGVRHNQWAGSGGATHESCVAYDCEPSTWRSTNATLFVSYSTPAAAGASYNNCYAYSDISGSAHDGFYSHTAGGSAHLTRVTYTNCYYYGPTSAATAADTENFAVNGFFSENLTGRSTSTWSFGSTLSTATNTIANVTAINPARLFNFAPNLVASDIRAYVAESISGGMVWNSNVTLTDSTICFNSAIADGNKTVFNTTGNAATFTNNVIQNGGFRNILSDGSISSDRNVIWRSGTAINSFEISGVAYSFANWQTNSGGDANSSYNVSQASPLVTDPANNDFTFTGSVVDQGGRTAGSRKSIARPNWAALKAAWSAGYLGIDGTGI